MRIKGRSRTLSAAKRAKGARQAALNSAMTTNGAELLRIFLFIVIVNASREQINNRRGD